MEAFACGNCGEPSEHLRLDGHYGSHVEIDVCPGCHLLWFDAFESVRLTGVALLELIGVMARAQSLPHRTLTADMHCPRCSGPLKTVANRSRFGATVQLECSNGHGLAQTFAQWLAEKGLWRELSSIDRAALASHDAPLHCLNCGAPLAAEPRCRWCDTPPGVIDIARLASALDPEGATEDDPLHRAPLERRSLNCAACGAALTSRAALRCPSCAATLAVTDLRSVRSALESLAPALKQHQLSPAPQVKRRRFERLRADLGRRREWVREMEKDVAPERDDPGAADLREWLASAANRRPASWALAVALAALLLWWLS